MTPTLDRTSIFVRDWLQTVTELQLPMILVQKEMIAIWDAARRQWDDLFRGRAMRPSERTPVAAGSPDWYEQLFASLQQFQAAAQLVVAQLLQLQQSLLELTRHVQRELASAAWPAVGGRGEGTTELVDLMNKKLYDLVQERDVKGRRDMSNHELVEALR